MLILKLKKWLLKHGFQSGAGIILLLTLFSYGQIHSSRFSIVEPSQAEIDPLIWILPISIAAMLIGLLFFFMKKMRHQGQLQLRERERELKDFATNLEESKESLEMQSNVIEFMVEAMADGLIVVNEKREYRRYNAVAKRLLGFGPEELRAQGLHNLPVKNPATGKPLTIDELPISRALKGESVTDMEMLVHPPGGTERILSFNTQPVFNHNGTLIGAIAVFRDITTRKALENELRKAQQSALETAQMKSRFLANMSHEIRTPMNGIIGMTELLAQTASDEKQKSYINLINESCQNLLTIINDILDFSKIEAGKLEIEKTDFNLAYAVDRTVQLLVPKAREKSLTLLSFVSPEIPITVRGDSGRLGQILVNLLSNALKFTSTGKVIIKAELNQLSKESIEVKFTVKDSGTGIPADQLHRLFQPFTQGDTSTSRKFGGTGLGLSICKQLVDLMGGRIGVESKPGEGSLFWFTIPFDLPLAVSPSPQSQFNSQTQVVLFDEDEDSAKILSEYMNTWNIPFIHLNEMSQLLDLIEHAGDLSHLHLMLSGALKDQAEILEALTRAAQLQPRPNVTLVTDTDDAAFITPYKELGFENFLFRPVQQNVLYNHLLKAISDPLQVDFTSLEESLQDAEPEEETRPLKSGRILLAEDNSVNQLIAQAFLKELGHSTHTVSNGREAVEALKQGEFDLILMDCQMPEMDGFEATEKIRNSLSSKIPIIALTANAMKGDEEKCRRAGMNAYLSKPFHKEQLQSLLQKFLPKVFASFDPGRLEMFRGYKDDQNQDLRKALISSYLQSAPGSISDLEKLGLKEPDQFRRVAHTLKSSTASVGGFYLARIFEELEASAPAPENLPQKLTVIQSEFEKLKRHLETYAENIA